jgi:DNA-binding NtrC family response regulator
VQTHGTTFLRRTYLDTQLSIETKNGNAGSKQSAPPAQKQAAQTTPAQTTVQLARLDLNKVPKIVGDEARMKVKRLDHALNHSNIPLYFVGDSGTGKTAMMKKVLAMYSVRNNVPAYYVQLSPEDTKTSILLGHRLIKGSLEVVEGVLAQAAREGACVGVDEITHSTKQMLLMFNAVDGGESVITIGDRQIDAGNMRIIYGSNRSSHIGNIKIPQSFANRLVAVPFDYPSAGDELEIASAVAEKNCKYPITVPESVIKYIVAYIREMRSSMTAGSQWPLSVRNAANAVILCQLEHEFKLQLESEKKRRKNTSGELVIASEFTRGQNVESTRKRIAHRIIGRSVDDATTMQRPEIVDFLQFVSFIGVSEFRECVKQAIGFYIDMDGVDYLAEAKRQELANSIV